VLGELYRLLPKPKVNANQARIRRQDPARLPNVLPDGPLLELRYVSANRFNLAGHISAQSCVFWFAQPTGRDAKGIRLASHEVPVIGIAGRRADFYQTSPSAAAGFAVSPHLRTSGEP
jgi:hypothetical protein